VNGVNVISFVCVFCSETIKRETWYVTTPEKKNIHKMDQHDFSIAFSLASVV
jgi:hypothetical protein